VNNPITTETPSSSTFWRQPTAERTLRQAVRHERTARAYLLTGPDGVGKWPAACWLGRSLLCLETDHTQRPCGTCAGCRRVTSNTHPDFRALFPVRAKSAAKDAELYLTEKAEDPFAVVRFATRPFIAIDRIRELIAELGRTSIEGGAKVTVIAQADQMRTDVQAIMLKTIEEPPPDAYFILTSADPGRLLPTVISRCQTIRFMPVDPEPVAQRLLEERDIAPKTAAASAALCGGGWGMAVRLASEEADKWRRDVATLWREAFHVDTGALIGRIDQLFRPHRKSVGLNRTLEAFDAWSYLLRCETEGVAGKPGLFSGDRETAWACYRILQNARATLFLNISERSTVTGAFVAMRRRAGRP
jgi:DNA polymerase-3 subunit delta'